MFGHLGKEGTVWILVLNVRYCRKGLLQIFFPMKCAATKTEDQKADAIVYVNVYQIMKIVFRFPACQVIYSGYLGLYKRPSKLTTTP